MVSLCIAHSRRIWRPLLRAFVLGAPAARSSNFQTSLAAVPFWELGSEPHGKPSLDTETLAANLLRYPAPCIEGASGAKDLGAPPTLRCGKPRSAELGAWWSPFSRVAASYGT